LIIACFPTAIWDVTRNSISEHAPQTRIIPVTGLTGAWDAYKSFWGEDDLMVIEQDIILHEDVIPQFEGCPEPWCLFPFRYMPGMDFLDTGTGCNRYRKEFMQEVPPDAVEAIFGSCPRCNGGENPGCWAHIDGRLHEAGEKAGFRIHVHWPSVGHRTIMPGEVND
jgi:hypothetical protein